MFEFLKNLGIARSFIRLLQILSTTEPGSEFILTIEYRVGMPFKDLKVIINDSMGRSVVIRYGEVLVFDDMDISKLSFRDVPVTSKLKDI